MVKSDYAAHLLHISQLATHQVASSSSFLIATILVIFLVSMQKYFFNKAIIFSTLITMLLGYFLYHTLNGNRGMIAYFYYTNLIAEKSQILADLEVKYTALERKARLLYPGDLDTDLLDELARHKLGLIAADEKCIITP